MKNKVIVPGLIGSTTLIIWTFLTNGILGFNSRYSMKRIPNEREVYHALKANISESGRYLCNPALTPEGRFPDHEPVFGILYSGGGHETAGFSVILGLIQFLLVPMIAAWLLSITSENFRSRLSNRISFFVIIGIFVAITGDINSYGIGGSPLSIALIYSLRTVITWTLLGLVMAPFMRPIQQAKS